MPEPFVQLPFASLPREPVRPHPYFSLRRERVAVRTDALGTQAVNVVVHGAGPPLLLVHGLMTSSYSWRYVFEPLGQHFTVFAPDLPGSGDSPPSEAPYTPEALADWLGATCRALGIDGCPVIGNSMGGYLCLWRWLREPRGFSRVVNLHGPGLPLKRLVALHAVLSAPGGERLLHALVRRDPVRWAFKNVHYYDESLKSLEEAEHYAAPLRTVEGRRAFANTLRHTMDPFAMRRFARAMREGGHEGRAPVALIYARRDPMVPPRVGHAMHAWLPQAPMVWLSEGSHFAHVDAVPAFLDAALPWLLGRS